MRPRCADRLPCSPRRRPRRRNGPRRCCCSTPCRRRCGSGCGRPAALRGCARTSGGGSRRGHDVDVLVQHLPTDHIVRAHDPAGYLRAVIQRAARDTAPPNDTAPPRGGLERTALAELVLRGLGADLGGEVLACRAWPGLAARLAQWQTRGLPLAELIADLPAGRLATARFPAAYARSVLAATIAAREEDPGPIKRTDNGPTRERRSSPPPGPRSASLRRDTSRGDGPADGVAKHRASTQDPTGLDPASAVDRVGIAARLGTGSVADDEAREALFDLAATPRNGGGDQPAAATATAEAGMHRGPRPGPSGTPPPPRPPTLETTRTVPQPVGSTSIAAPRNGPRPRKQPTLSAQPPPGPRSRSPRPRRPHRPRPPSPGHPRVTPPRPPRPRLTPTPRRRPS